MAKQDNNEIKSVFRHLMLYVSRDIKKSYLLTEALQNYFPQHPQSIIQTILESDYGLIFDEIIAEIIKHSLEDSQAVELDQLIPDETNILRFTAVQSSLRCIGYYSNLKSTNTSIKLIESWQNYAQRLSDIGKHQEAITASAQAVALSRLLQQDKNNYQQASILLADNLEHLSDNLSNIGHNIAAIAAAREALQLLQSDHLNQHKGNCCKTAYIFTALAALYMDNEQTQEALQSAQAATEIHKLCENNTHTISQCHHTHTYCLKNQGLILAETFHIDQFIETITKATRLCRVLVKYNRQFRDELAQSLELQAIAYWAINNKNALNIARKQAFAIQMELTREQPDSYYIDTANTMLKKAGILSNNEHHDEAKKLANLAQEAFQDLCILYEDAHSPDLVNVLISKAQIYTASGNFKTALQDIKQAIHRLKRLCQTYPKVDSYVQKLTTCQNIKKTITKKIKETSPA